MGIKAVTAIDELRNWGRPVIATGEVARLLHLSESSASHLMRRLSSDHLVERVGRGRWLLDREDPLAPVAFLALPHPSYVSGMSALARHDMIDQVPRTIEVVTPGRSRTITTLRGRYVLQAIDNALFDGWILVNEVPIATPEKALFDAVYLRAARGMADVHLPEIELPQGFDDGKLETWMARIESARVVAATRASLARILALAERTR